MEIIYLIRVKSSLKPLWRFRVCKSATFWVNMEWRIKIHKLFFMVWFLEEKGMKKNIKGYNYKKRKWDNNKSTLRLVKSFIWIMLMIKLYNKFEFLLYFSMMYLLLIIYLLWYTCYMREIDNEWKTLIIFYFILKMILTAVSY